MGEQQVLVTCCSQSAVQMREPPDDSIAGVAQLLYVGPSGDGRHCMEEAFSNLGLPSTGKLWSLAPWRG